MIIYLTSLIFFYFSYPEKSRLSIYLFSRIRSFKSVFLFNKKILCTGHSFDRINPPKADKQDILDIKKMA